jgi:hypothetical protein
VHTYTTDPEAYYDTSFYLTVISLFETGSHYIAQAGLELMIPTKITLLVQANNGESEKEDSERRCTASNSLYSTHLIRLHPPQILPLLTYVTRTGRVLTHTCTVSSIRCIIWLDPHSRPCFKVRNVHCHCPNCSTAVTSNHEDKVRPETIAYV